MSVFKEIQSNYVWWQEKCESLRKYGAHSATIRHQVSQLVCPTCLQVITQFVQKLILPWSVSLKCGLTTDMCMYLNMQIGGIVESI